MSVGTLTSKASAARQAGRGLRRAGGQSALVYGRIQPGNRLVRDVDVFEPNKHSAAVNDRNRATRGHHLCQNGPGDLQEALAVALELALQLAGLGVLGLADAFDLFVERPESGANSSRGIKARRLVDRFIDVPIA